MCPTLCDPVDCSLPGFSLHGITRLLPPWDSPGKNTGVGCHFLLQCVKVESESEVTQLCPILCDTMDCSLPGSSIHGSYQARVLEWVASVFSIKKSTNDKCWRGCEEQGTLLHCRWECKLIQPLWKMVWRFLKKLGIKSAYDPPTPRHTP